MPPSSLLSSCRMTVVSPASESAVLFPLNKLTYSSTGVGGEGGGVGSAGRLICIGLSGLFDSNRGVICSVTVGIGDETGVWDGMGLSGWVKIEN